MLIISYILLLRSLLRATVFDGLNLLRIFYVNRHCVPIKHATINNPLPDPSEVHLYKAIPSTSGYMIRPFVELCGQRNGYQWEDRQKGFWREFLDSHIKNFTLEITGIIMKPNQFFISLKII